MQRPGAGVRRAHEGLEFARLMDFSERRLALAAEQGGPHEARLASRLLGDLPLYRKWEHAHGHHMRSIAVQRRAAQRQLAARKAALQALHRKAPFEFMRDHAVTGDARHRLVQALFGQQDYAHCVIGEHEAYMSSACSLLCTDALCRERFADGAFAEALGRYEAAYAEYFRAFCESQLALAYGQAAPLHSLLPYLRHQLQQIREHLLSDDPGGSDYSQLQALYAETGSTQRMKALRG